MIVENGGRRGSGPGVLAIVTGLDVYHLGLLQGMSEALSGRNVPLHAYTNALGVSGHANVDGGQEAVPALLRSWLRLCRPLGVVLTMSLSSLQHEAWQDELRQQEIPAVYVAQDVPGRACVRAANAEGMRTLMAHLLDECGVRRPVMVRGFAHHVDHVERETVLREELARRGLPVDEGLFVDGSAEREVTRNSLRVLLGARRDLDAVVTTDDWCALAAVEALTEAGLRVPEDVCVTGFDNYSIARLSWPGITTVDQELREQGVQAVRQLLRQADGRTVPDRTLVSCRLVVRSSTRAQPDPGEGNGPPTTTTTATTARRVAGGAERLPAPFGAPPLEEVARLATEHVLSHNAVRRAGRALSGCRSLEEISDALASCLPQLQIPRCFLVIYEQAVSALPAGTRAGDDERHGIPAQPGPSGDDALPDPFRDDGPSPACRLILDYHGGRTWPVPSVTFPLSAVVPDRLAGELDHGFLALWHLNTLSGTLGYILLEQPFVEVPVAESLQRDVALSLEALFNIQALQAHADRLEELVRRRTSELESEIIVRRRTERELQRSLVTDPLTGVANRRAFAEAARREWDLHLVDQDELALLMVDVDLFKAYNDHYGHLQGDEALCAVASCLSRAVRSGQDLVTRFGGEEFIVILPRTNAPAAASVAGRFRQLLAETAIPHAASTVSPLLTASVGIATLVPTPDTSFETVLATADHALYRAKDQGRDRAVVAGSVIDSLPRPATPTDLA